MRICCVGVVLVSDMVAFATHLPPCHRISRDSVGGELLNFLKNVQFWGFTGCQGIAQDKAIDKQRMWRRSCCCPASNRILPEGLRNEGL